MTHATERKWLNNWVLFQHNFQADDIYAPKKQKTIMRFDSHFDLILSLESSTKIFFIAHQIVVGLFLTVLLEYQKPALQ